MNEPRKRAVSKAQFKFFQDVLGRIEAGEPSPIKGMTAESLQFALDVDYDSLPERAGRAALKPQPKLRVLRPQPSRSMAQPASEPAVAHAHAHAVSFEAYLAAHPKSELHQLPAVCKAAAGSFLFQVEPNGLPHWLVRTKTAAKTVAKSRLGQHRCRVWTLVDAQAFLTALGTTVKTVEQAAQELAYCPACAQGVPREEQGRAPMQSVSGQAA